jgi:hypothetical protein
MQRCPFLRIYTVYCSYLQTIYITVDEHILAELGTDKGKIERQRTLTINESAPGNRRHPTIRNKQQTTYNDTLHSIKSALDNRHSTPNNKQLPPTDAIDRLETKTLNVGPHFTILLINRSSKVQIPHLSIT